MAATTVVIGRVTPRSESAAMFVRDGASRGTWRQVQPTRTPIVDLDPCPCGKPDCDRDEWHEMMGDVCEVCGNVGCDCITPQAQAALLARIDADPHAADGDGVCNRPDSLPPLRQALRL